MAGKTALVTGGGSGIGAGIARLFAHHGAKVALLGRKADKLEAKAAVIGEAGGSASVHPCDVRDFAALEGAMKMPRARAGSTSSSTARRETSWHLPQR